MTDYSRETYILRIGVVNTITQLSPQQEHETVYFETKYEWLQI